MIDRIASHYEGRWLRGYVRGKLRNDPVFGAAFDLLKDSDLPVLDVGCGIGLFEFYLRERGFTAPLRGVDFDGKKIKQARQIAGKQYRDIEFSTGDVLDARSFQGQVVIFDVLHYLDAARQAELLAGAASQVAPGGLCVIRTTPRDESWRFRFTQVEEFFLRASLWMKSGAVHFPSVEEVLAPFHAAGFQSAVHPLWGKTPFNSHLFVLRKTVEDISSSSLAHVFDVAHDPEAHRRADLA